MKNSRRTTSTTARHTPAQPLATNVTGTTAPGSKSTSAKASSGIGSAAIGRAYPLHTGINATTFWIGEQFQNTPDGSQVCSAYDSQWQYDYFHNKTGKLSQGTDCSGAYYGGCDALLNNPAKPCNDSNSIASLRTPANGYFPSGLPPIFENPFYLDLPVDDYNPSDKTDTTAYLTRCQVIPWADDPGYAGHCTDSSFSYMKNRWVKVMAHGQTCYGQIEDAGPADDGNGNGNYDDVNYVFGATDARPYNTSYNNAGMDVSTALGACLQGKFNQDLSVSWQFVDAGNVPPGPWKTIITTDPPN